jgi:hypothetical protein
MSTDVALKPRKSEKIWMWTTIILGSVLVLSFITEYVHANGWIITIAILAFIALLWALSRTEKPWQYADAIKATRKTEGGLTGTEFDDSVESAEVVPYGNVWLVYYRTPAVTFTVDPVKRLIIGRQIRTPDTIIHATDRSETLKAANARAVVEEKTKVALESVGVDTDEEEHNET